MSTTPNSFSKAFPEAEGAFLRTSKSAGNGLRNGFMTITPEMAKVFLASRICNRGVMPSRVNAYASMMLGGRWYPENPYGLVFNSDWNLIVGQHRLLAVIKANQPVQFMVSFGYPESLSSVIDSGKSWSYKDIAKAQVDTNTMPENIEVGNLPKDDKALYRILQISHIEVYYGSSNGTPANHLEVVDNVWRYFDSASFAHSVIKPGISKLSVLPIAAAIGLAYLNGVSKSTLRAFGEIFMTGMPPNPVRPGTSAVLRLREFAIAFRPGGGVHTRMLMGTAQKAIDKFSRGQEVAKLHPVQKLCYCLPEAEKTEPVAKVQEMAAAADSDV